MTDSKSTTHSNEHRERKGKRKERSSSSKPSDKLKRRKNSQTSKSPTKTDKPELFKEEELHCIVCFEFPPGNIFQCGNGHLMCEGCYDQVVDSVKPICPTCRVKLNREKPSRNRFAESVLSSLIVPCPNEGCDLKLKFANVKVHSTNECGYHKTECKFNSLGCDWSGLEKDRRVHQKQCVIRVCTPSTLLKKVKERNKQKAEEKKNMEEIAASQKEVCNFLTKRCRDLVFRDVVLEKDVITNEMCSKTFTALGAIWECVLNPKEDKDGTSTPSQTVSVFLRVVCPNKRAINLAVIVLPGPDLASTPLRPSVHRAKLKKSKNKQSTPPFVLPFEKDHVDRIYEMDKINLRIGLVDFSSGRASSSFFSGHGNTGASESETDLSDEDEDGLDIITEPTSGLTGGRRVSVRVLRLRPLGPIGTIHLNHYPFRR